MVSDSTKQVNATISTGHAYDKHVLGKDNSRHPGENEFRKPALGRDLGITTKNDLKNYMDSFFDKEGTQGFADPKTHGRYVFYNAQDNVAVIFNPHARNNDLGTIFRPDEKAQFFKGQIDTAREYHKVPMAKTPDAISNLTDGFVKNLVDLPTPKQTGIFNRITGALEELGKGNKNIVVDVGIAAGIGTAMLAGGSSPAEAAEAAAETLNPLPETTAALTQGRSAGEVAEAAVQDGSALAGCVAGGYALGKAGFIGGSAVNPGIGTTVGTVGGGLIGCLGGAWVASGISDRIFRFFSGDDTQDVTLDEIREILPEKPVPDMPPEFEALVEVQSSDPLMQETLDGLQQDGSFGEFMVPELQEQNQLHTQQQLEQDYAREQALIAETQRQLEQNTAAQTAGSTPQTLPGNAPTMAFSNP